MVRHPETPAPTAFIGHGSPMNALEDNRFTRSWKAFGASVPRPRAVLVDGYFGGSLSMTSYSIGAPCPPVATGAGAAAVPDPGVVPPDQTNT